MRAIIAGGRDYAWTEADFGRLDRLRAEHGITEVVSGGATGADRLGELWAKSRALPRRVFRADWKTHGRAAGPRRNAEMAAYADMVRRARARGLLVKVIEFQ